MPHGALTFPCPVCEYMELNVYMCAHAQKCVHAFTCINSYVHMHERMCAHTCSYVCTCMSTNNNNHIKRPICAYAESFQVPILVASNITHKHIKLYSNLKRRIISRIFSRSSSSNSLKLFSRNKIFSDIESFIFAYYFVVCKYKNT